MKKFYALLILVNIGLLSFASKVTVTNSGTTFSPSAVIINSGDTVVFQLSNSHNVVEVSQATYNANGNTSNGGFSLPFGGGSIKLSNAGVYYYVCSPHASLGMKGTITVNAASGVQNIESNPDLTMYSLPSSNSIKVTFDNTSISKVSYSLITSNGKVIYTKGNVNKTAGKVEEYIQPNFKLTPGLYILKVQTSDGARLAGKVFIRN
jgi:plastocyanin